MAKTATKAKAEEVFDGPKVEHDALIKQMFDRSAEEYARSSDASESAALTKAFLEETGLNSQAFSWGKSILKKLPKKDGQSKAMDVIRSLNTILPMLENHVVGQGTAEMDLGDPEDGAEAPDDEGEEGSIEDDEADFLAATDDLDDEPEDGDGEFEGDEEGAIEDDEPEDDGKVVALGGSK